MYEEISLYMKDFFGLILIDFLFLLEIYVLLIGFKITVLDDLDTNVLEYRK